MSGLFDKCCDCGCDRQSSTDNAIPRYKNTTTVPSRDCGNNYGQTGQDACSDPDNPSRVPPFPWHECTVDDTPPCSTAVPPPRVENTFAAYDPPQYVDRKVCLPTGFKNVIAQKQFHGRYGFGDPDTCGGCPSRSDANPTPTLTRYRTLSWSGTGTQTFGGGAGGNTYTCSGSCTVDRYSGKTTTTFFEELAMSGNTAPATVNPVSGNGDISNLVAALLGTGYCAGSWQAGANSDLLNNPPDYYIVDALTASSTEIHIAMHVDPSSDYYAALGKWDFDVTITLSDPYTSGDLNTDCNDLLAQWDLSDDSQYPWRTDLLCNFGPLVTRDEPAATSPAPLSVAGPNPPDDFESGTVSGTDEDGNSWSFTFDPDEFGEGPASASYSGTIISGTATGNIIGKPTPAGYDAYWDSTHANYDGQTTIQTWGASSPYWCPQATQWTDESFATQLYPGAFAKFSANGGGLLKAKWAEVVVRTAPAYNWGRPWGLRDTMLRDQSTVDCGSEEPCSEPYPNQYGDLLFPNCFGIDGRNVITEATNATPIQITLQRPAGWRTGDTIDISGCAGNTAANGSARAITVINSTTATIDGSAGNGDYVANSGYAISTGAPDYHWNDQSPKGDWVLLTWTNDFRNSPDTSPTVVQSQQNSPAAIHCCPPVIYITPQDGTQPIGETTDSKNATSCAHPNLDCDFCFGALWQSIPKQWMTDPLWQRPAMPCDLLDNGCTMLCAWSEDDGSGKPDDDPADVNPCNYYFPQRPMVECRVAPPLGAPALPAGFTLINPNDRGTLAPQLGDNVYMPVWFWSANRAQTVAIAGRFSCDYADPMAVCSDDPDASPL